MKIDLGKFDEEIMEEAIKNEPVEAKKTWRTKIEDFWEVHKKKIIGAGLVCLAIGGCAAKAVYDIKQNKLLDEEIKDRFGPNVIHGNFGFNKADARRADLKIWEEGKGKENFDKVMNFVKTLSLDDDEEFYIERCIKPDESGMCTSVYQVRGLMGHGDWF